MNIPFVLDVAIGLVFIYLLLSLIASELQELITTVLQWRAKHLKDSIEVLLAGGTGTPEEAEVKAFVDRLYNDPLLRNVNQGAKGFFAQGFRQLSRLFWANRKGSFGNQDTGPSYIAPETFATSLTERLGVGQLAAKLTEVRLEKFITRMIGIYHLNEAGEIMIPADDALKDSWEKGNIRVIGEKSGRLNLHEDANFRRLVEDCFTVFNDFKPGRCTLETAVERLAEDLDRFIQSYPDAEPGDQALSFPDRLESFKRGIFGSDNKRAILAGGLKPSLSEVADIVNQGSDTYKEIEDAYQVLKTQIPPIQDKVEAAIDRQLEAYNNSETPPLTLKRGDLSNEQYLLFVNNAQRELSSEELQLYRDYQTFTDIDKVLNSLPTSIRDSMAVLGRRAQTRVVKAESDLHQFQEEIALWFDRSMSRASGVYKRNAKGVAILVGLSIAFGTNSDTFHIFNRLSSDENLREVIVKRASEIAPNSSAQPVTKEDLEKIKQNTDAVLRDVSLPISWTPSNLIKQFDCPPARPLSEKATYEEEWLNLFAACQQKEQPTRELRFEEKVMKLGETALLYHPWPAFKMFLGWFLSGLAIAMGAPFWFDLLGKVVNVRNSGGKPAAKAEPATQAAAPKS
jgi:hypothetical protein